MRHDAPPLYDVFKNDGILQGETIGTIVVTC